jgi:ABC-2 type transport system ATP-binding protein
VTAEVVASGLSRSFGEDHALVGVDLAVRAGEIHALVGLNGAGKTTLMRTLLGMLRPDRGRAEVLGSDVREARAELWGRVGHMIDAPFGYPELTVRENLQAAALLHGLSKTDARAAGGRLLEQLRLSRWADRRSRSLSTGNRQRLGLGCALVHDPLVLVLDEPTNALDPSGVVLVRHILTTAAENGAAILVSSHHLDEMARMADHISVLHRGRVVGSLDPHGADLERTFFELILAVDTAEGLVE